MGRNVYPEILADNDIRAVRVRRKLQPCGQSKSVVQFFLFMQEETQFFEEIGRDWIGDGKQRCALHRFFGGDNSGYRCGPVEMQGRGTSGLERMIRFFQRFIAAARSFHRRDRQQAYSKRGGIKRLAAFGGKRNRAAEERGVQETGDALSAVIGKSIETKLAPGFSVERGHLVERQNVARRMFRAALEVENLHRGARTVPGIQILTAQFGIRIGIGGESNRFGSEEAGGLMMAVATVNAAPIVDDNVGAEVPNDTDHVFDDLIAPDFFGFFGGFGKAEVTSACEEEPHAITACGSEQFLGADEAELRSLFGAECVLAAFAAGEGEKSDVGVEATSEISEDGGGFVVGMRGDVENACGDAGAVDGFNGFGEAGTGAGSGGKLRRSEWRE